MPHNPNSSKLRKLNKLFKTGLFSFAIQAFIPTHYPKLRDQKYLTNEVSFSIQSQEPNRLR